MKDVYHIILMYIIYIERERESGITKTVVLYSTHGAHCAEHIRALRKGQTREFCVCCHLGELQCRQNGLQLEAGEPNDHKV